MDFKTMYEAFSLPRDLGSLTEGLLSIANDCGKVEAGCFSAKRASIIISTSSQSSPSFSTRRFSSSRSLSVSTPSCRAAAIIASKRAENKPPFSMGSSFCSTSTLVSAFGSGFGSSTGSGLASFPVFLFSFIKVSSSR